MKLKVVQKAIEDGDLDFGKLLFNQILHSFFFKKNIYILSTLKKINRYINEKSPLFSIKFGFLHNKLFVIVMFENLFKDIFF
jgi:hypothetical protein